MKKTLALVAIPFLLFLFTFSCEDSDNVAQGNARLFLSADPPEIGLKGTSTLTVTGTDEDGAPLPDGTQVSFSVDQAGRVEPSSVQLLNGTATSTYFATLSAGDITITATSGGVQAHTTVTVADNIEENVFVSATPATFPTGGGTAIISAIVTDGAGKPLAGNDVRFSTTAGELQSSGAPIETNNNGLATDVLNTTESATVTATSEDGFTGQTTVLVGVGRVVCHMSASTSTPTVGQTVFVFDTSDNPGDQIVSYHWDFGDGASTEGKNSQHAYSTAGPFEIIHSVTDRQGITVFCEPFPIRVSE
jgi:hypothetical protein